jgi:DNA-binding transcriptional LysR family regulator
MTGIELRQFRYFTAVAEERHFGRAAERLRIAQPGLSRQIKAMERQLGVQLFERHSRGVALTVAGEALLGQARLVIEFAGRAADTARLAMHGKTALIKVGTPAAGIHPGANDLLRTFQARNPKVGVEVHPGFVDQTMEALFRHALDVAIVIAPFTDAESFRYLPLGSVELLAAIPAGHPLASFDRIPRSALLREPFLDWPRTMNPPLVDHLRQSLFGRSDHPQGVEVADVTEANRLLLVADGRGLAVPLFPSLAELKIPGVVFKPLAHPASLEYGIAWLDVHVSPVARAFVDIAREIAASPGRQSWDGTRSADVVHSRGA